MSTVKLTVELTIKNLISEEALERHYHGTTLLELLHRLLEDERLFSLIEDDYTVLSAEFIKEEVS